MKTICKKISFLMVAVCMILTITACTGHTVTPETVVFVEEGKFYTPDWFTGYTGSVSESSPETFIDAAKDALLLHDGVTVAYKPVIDMGKNYPDAQMESHGRVEIIPSYVFDNKLYMVESIASENNSEAAIGQIVSYDVDTKELVKYPFTTELYMDTPYVPYSFRILYADDKEIYYCPYNINVWDYDRTLYCYNIAKDIHTVVYDFPNESEGFPWTFDNLNTAVVDGKLYFNEFIDEGKAALIQLDLSTHQVVDTGIMGYWPFDDGNSLCYLQNNVNDFTVVSTEEGNLYATDKNSFARNVGKGGMIVTHTPLVLAEYVELTKNCPNMEQFASDFVGADKNDKGNDTVATSAIGYYDGEKFHPLISGTMAQYCSDQTLWTDGRFISVNIEVSGRRALLLYDKESDGLIELAGSQPQSASVILTEDYIVILSAEGMYSIAKTDMKYTPQ